MKKPMEQLKEIMGVDEGQPVTNSTSKELREVKRQIKIFVKCIKAIMVIAIIAVVGFSFGCVGIALDYALTMNSDAGEEIYTAIQGIITSAAILYITAVCRKFCESIIKSETPFILQVPKGLRKIAAAIVIMIFLSIVAEAVYSVITDTEFTLFIDASGWASVCILMLLSSIFDYGCKLQQESDETI